MGPAKGRIKERKGLEPAGKTNKQVSQTKLLNYKHRSFRNVDHVFPSVHYLYPVTFYWKYMSMKSVNAGLRLCTHTVNYFKMTSTVMSLSTSIVFYQLNQQRTKGHIFAGGGR